MVSAQLLNDLKRNPQINKIQIKHFEQLMVEDYKKYNKPKRE
jgi:hypothetical protein